MQTKDAIRKRIINQQEVLAKAGVDLFDFDEAIFEKDVEFYTDVLRELGIDTFTVSTCSTNLCDILTKFEECGCKLIGLVKIVDRFDADSKSKNAFLLQVL